ncbi:MAG TPA: T9SS type A sorting domain-containing protein [Flavobacterium sp.]|jgi:hypothetical protein
MKKLLLSAALCCAIGLNAQVTVFEDSFETYEDFAITGFGDWITIDTDGLETYIGGLPDTATESWTNGGDPQAWMVFNPTAAGVSNSTDACVGGNENRNFDPRTGAKYAGSWASVPPDAGTPDRNDDWLISPPVTLGTSNNNVSFWVKELSTCYADEQFRVGVYTGSGIPTATQFTVISGIQPVNVNSTSWVQKTYSLAAYNNQTIRIGIRNIGKDHYMLMVDDFLVTSSNLGANDVLASKFATYPNPSNGIVTLSNLENIRVSQIQITDLNGRTVKTLSVSDASADIQVNIADLSAGVYMMNIDSDQGKAVKKIVKQ